MVALFCGLFYFSDQIFMLLAQPLLRHLPEGTSLIATNITTPLLTPLKLTFILAIFLSVPVLLYEIWSFVAPGLYQREKRLVAPLIFLSSLLFVAGMAFAYFVVFPLVFGFFANIVPHGVKLMPDISSYLDVTLKLFFAFGLAFEVPIAIILLVSTGVASPAKIASKRAYVIVGAFVVGMLLTPPDVISQVLLAVPIWLLFEGGLLLSRLFMPSSKERTAQA